VSGNLARTRADEKKIFQNFFFFQILIKDNFLSGHIRYARGKGDRREAIEH
jgi:hypothetical protein